MKEKINLIQELIAIEESYIFNKFYTLPEPEGQDYLKEPHTKIRLLRDILKDLEQLDEESI